MNTLILAAAQVKGPHIDWAALSPVLAPAAGGLIVLLVGLLSSSLVRERVVPALTLIAFAASIGCRDLALQRPGLDRLRSAANRRPGADPRHAVLGRRDRHRAAVAGRRRAATRGTGRVPRAAAIQRDGDGRVRLGPEPGDAVHRDRAAVDTALRPVRIGDPQRALARVWPQVPGDWVGRLGDAGLRAGADLRLHRRDRLLGDRLRDRPRQARRRHRRGPDVAHGRRAVDRRVRVQGVGGPVPPVDSGRLRGRADADHGVHGHRHQGRRARGVPAVLRRRGDRHPRQVGPAGVGRRRDHDRRRQRRRARPVVGEADPRLLRGRSGGVHARRRGRRHQARRPGHRPVPDRLPDDELRGVRGDRRPGARADRRG